MVTTQVQLGPGRPLLDSVIRFLVWTWIIACVSAPLLLVALFYFELWGSFPLSRGSDAFNRTAESIFSGRPAVPAPKIATGVLAQERARQIERLNALTGRAEMASGAAASIHLVAVAFEGIKPDAVEAVVFPRQRVYPDGYRRLTLDMAQAQREGVVLVSDQAIRWSIVGLQPGAWPRVGFEGYAAFDVADGQPGSLAGFRIGVFGFGEVARAVDPTKGEVSIPQTFCASVQTWVQHFGVFFDAARFTLLLNPTRVAPRPGVIASDGEIAKTLLADEIEGLCKRRSRHR
jgi:hypothetical protein